MRKEYIPFLGLLLQGIFFLLIFQFQEFWASLSVYTSALIVSVIGITSFFIGTWSLIKKINVGISYIVVFLGALIILFFIFAYLLSEAGIPAP